MQKSRLDEMTDLFKKGIETARGLGADGAKFSYWQNESISCDFENARIKSTETRQSLGYFIEILIGGRRGSTQGNDPADLDDLIGRTATLARVGGVAHFKEYPAPGRYAGVRTYSPRTLDLSRDRLIQACEAVVGPLKAHDAGLYISAGASRTETESLLVTSGGVQHASRGTGWSLGGQAQRTRGTDMLFAGASRWWKDLNELFDPGYVTGRILTDLRRSETTVDSPAGTPPVLLSPDLVGMFMWPILEGVNGRNVAKGESPLRDKLGRKIADSSITLVDDPHVDFDNGAAETDDNGIPTTRLEIVRDGVLKGFLYDLDSAGMAGVPPTGHNGCSPHSLALAPGRRPRDELLRSIADGLYVKELIGFGQSNTINGDVSGNVALGFRVRNGEIVGRVKDTIIAGNVYDLLKEGVELSSEVDPVRRMPYAVISGLTVSARK